MAEDRKETDVSRHAFAVAYDGSSLPDDAHSIDVQALAPALLAFGRLIREANTEFNGKKATAKVSVVSDFDHKCFNINFEVVLSYYQQLKTLLGLEDIKTAKEVLEWLGLLGIPAGAALTYLAFLKWKKGRKVAEVTPVIDKDETGTVQVRLEGEGHTVQVHTHVYKLSENPRALRATRDAFLPLGQDGFDTVKVRQNDKIVETIEPEEVASIVASCNVGLEVAQRSQMEPEVETSPAWLSVYSPVYDLSAPSWRFRLGKDVIYADISETSIAKDAMERGAAGVEDSYQVKLESTTEFDEKGNKLEPRYKVLEVTRFVPAGPPLRQADMFDPQKSTPITSGTTRGRRRKLRTGGPRGKKGK